MEASQRKSEQEKTAIRGGEREREREREGKKEREREKKRERSYSRGEVREWGQGPGGQGQGKRTRREGVNQSEGVKCTMSGEETLTRERDKERVRGVCMCGSTGPKVGTDKSQLLNEKERERERFVSGMPIHGLNNQVMRHSAQRERENLQLLLIKRDKGKRERGRNGALWLLSFCDGQVVKEASGYIKTEGIKTRSMESEGLERPKR